MAEEAGGVVDVLADKLRELAAEGDEGSLALIAALQDFGERVPLAFVFVGIDQVDAAVERAGNETVATSLAFFLKDVAVFHLLFETGVGVGAEGEEGDVDIGLAKLAVDHSAAAEFADLGESVGVGVARR